MLRHLLAILVLTSLAAAQAAPASFADRIHIKLDTSEADAVLAILEKSQAKQPITNADWQRLFTSEPYVRLKRRESAMHRDFTDDDFRRFVLSPDLAARHGALVETLGRWKQADLHAAAAHILPYLPADARIDVSVYPEIKPKPNSFVFEGNAIFLYLDPQKSAASFENTVAHEMHHIGLSSAEAAYDKIVEAALEPKREVLNWIGAFGEGLAVLAAAGSPDVHPLSSEPEADRICWDQDVKYWDSYLGEVDQFFRDVLAGGYKDKEVISHVAFTFFGYRGPWYTVGYKMGTIIEKKYGRAALLEGMTDPRKLILRYNDAAAAFNATNPAEKMPLWSPEVIAAMK